MTEIAGLSPEKEGKKKKEYQDTLYLQIKEMTGYVSHSDSSSNDE